MHNTDNSSPDAGTGRFKSDTQKLMHRHLQDKGHVITEEELKGLRVGMMPSADAVDDALKDDKNENGTSDNPPAPPDAVKPQNT